MHRNLFPNKFASPGRTFYKFVGRFGPRSAKALEIYASTGREGGSLVGVRCEGGTAEKRIRTLGKGAAMGGMDCVRDGK